MSIAARFFARFGCGGDGSASSLATSKSFFRRAFLLPFIAALLFLGGMNRRRKRIRLLNRGNSSVTTWSRLAHANCVKHALFSQARAEGFLLADVPTGSQDLRRDGVCHAGDIPDLGSCRRGEARTEVKRLANSVALEAKPAALRGDPILWGMVPTLSE